MGAPLPRDQSLAENLRSVVTRINQITAVAECRQVRLVAVSKLKPATDVLALYQETGHRHMGENYVQELIDKALILPTDIAWHFIGVLQTNKCRKLASTIPNLFAVESVDALKKATLLDQGRATLTTVVPTTKLRVYVQVNTSGEASKSGCPPAEAPGIAQHILEACPHLALQGLMTIGSRGEADADFRLLKQTAETIEAELGVKLELSMGMSGDYEQAIMMGATNVRVGTAIFGERPVRVEEETEGKA